VVETSATVVINSIQDNAAGEDDKYGVATTSMVETTVAKHGTSKRMRRQRLRNLKRQRRHRRKRDSHDKGLSAHLDEARSKNQVSDRYTTPTANVIGIAQKVPKEESNKYVTTTSINHKVVANEVAEKDNYFVDTPTRTVHSTNHSTPHIDEDKYFTASPVTVAKAPAGSASKPTKTQYAVDIQKVMLATKKHSDMETEQKYTIPISSQPKKVSSAPVTKCRYEVGTTAVGVKTTSRRDIQKSDKYNAGGLARAKPLQVNTAKSLSEKSDQYAVDTLATKAPATRHRDTSDSGDKYAVLTSTEKKVEVKPTLASVTPTVDTHALAPKITARTVAQQRKASVDGGMYEVSTAVQTKAVKSEASNRYLIEASPAVSHATHRKAGSGGADKYSVPCSRLKTATASAPASEKHVLDVSRIITTKRRTRAESKKPATGSDSGDNNGYKYTVSTSNKYAVSTSNKLKVATKIKIATKHDVATKLKMARQRRADARELKATNKNPRGEDKYDVPISSKKPVVTDPTQSATDKYAVQVDSKPSSVTSVNKGGTVSKRALRRQRLRAIKRRRERRRRGRRSRGPSRDSPETNNDIMQLTSEKAVKDDPKCEIVSGIVERLV